jgi:NTE family protein
MSNTILTILMIVCTVTFLFVTRTDYAAAGETSAVTTPQIPAQQEVINRPKVGLALGGGGTRGAAHVGVLKVLQREGIPIDFVAGTSIGAIVGGLYCAGLTPDEIGEKVTDLSLLRSFLFMPIYLGIAEEPFKLTRSAAHQSYLGLYNGHKFFDYLTKSIPACKKEISSLSIPFQAVALNLVDGHVYGIGKGNLGLAMLASSAVPSLRQPVPIEDKLFVDGGVMDNLPIDIVKKMGADIVIAVNVDETVREVSSDHFKAMGTIPRRLLLLQLANSDTAKEEGADIVIHPNVDDIGLTSINVADGKRAIESGEEAANAALPAIRAALAQKTLSVDQR